MIVDEITTDDPAITCRWAQGPNTMATLKIQVDRRRLHSGTLESAVHVRISGPFAETLTIPVKCVVK